jgi:hypothetical protein
MSEEVQTGGPVAGRRCGDCSMCCKLPGIDAVEKPEGVWCRHCAPGRGGCLIYEQRPVSCRTFYCDWISDAALGDEWRPLNCKMIVHTERSADRLAVHVDPNYPGAWRREPYYGQLKRWARAAADARRQVVVFIRRRVIVILPDKDVDLGDMAPGDQIWVGAQETPTGVAWGAFRIPADVPPEQAGAWIRSHAGPMQAV